MAKHGRKKLSMEISSLTIITSLGSVLILGLTVVFMFMFLFSRQAKSDMEYYIDNTLQQFDDKIQYIKDGAISIRHNNIVDGFFNKNHFDREQAETQLTYCLNLFSPRNMVNEGTPFVVHAYIFNNRQNSIRSSYYPETLAAAEKTDVYFRNLEQKFVESGKQYQIYRGERSTELCFQILNREMKKMGTCIVSIQNKAIEDLFSGVQKYEDSCWLVTDCDGQRIAAGGGEQAITDLSAISNSTGGAVRLDGVMSFFTRELSGFGLRSSIAIGKSNLYAVLNPTMISFVFVLIVVLIVDTTLVLSMSYRMTKPLKEMAEEISSYGHESLTMHMSDFPIEEFHSISVVFNDMVDRINHLVTQIYEKELLATRAQVKFLQSQINPHFQFNILAMFSLRAKMTGDEELYQGLRAFSKLMQGKIFREKEIKIRLSEEMELVKFYLYLQSSRFGDKITYEIVYGDPKVENYRIPRLLIEPLVENAVSHGLEPKSGAGHIRIEVFEENCQLHIIVQDDGIGFSQPDDMESPSLEKTGHTSTGIANTRRFLDILYGENHKMTIHGAHGKGTRVEIIIPVEGGTENVESNCGR